MTTRALFQKSAPRDSPSGASGLVLSSPRSRMALIRLRECRTMVDFFFISARFLGADDVDEVFAPPGEHHPIHLCIDPAERNKANLSVVFPLVDPLHDFVGKISAAVRNET